MINIKEWLNLNKYTSELDQFLHDYDKTHPKLSNAQLREVEKYAKVFKLRDKASQNESNNSFWENF